MHSYTPSNNCMAISRFYILLIDYGRQVYYWYITENILQCTMKPDKKSFWVDLINTFIWFNDVVYTVSPKIKYTLASKPSRGRIEGVPQFGTPPINTFIQAPSVLRTLLDKSVYFLLNYLPFSVWKITFFEHYTTLVNRTVKKSYLTS